VAEVQEHLQASLADRYRLDTEIGRGGMATVYLAQDLKHRRPSPSRFSTRTWPRMSVPNGSTVK
jgi:hypothetical protein